MAKKRERLAEQVLEAMRREYALLDDAGTEAIAPEMVADRVYKTLDPSTVSPTLVRYVAVLELRQLARAICRRKTDDGADDGSPHSLFPELQRRYPAERNGVATYVLREKLTLAERRRNVATLRAESAAKAAHADSLEAETDELLSSGYFDEEVSPRERGGLDDDENRAAL